MQKAAPFPGFDTQPVAMKSRGQFAVAARTVPVRASMAMRTAVCPDARFSRRVRLPPALAALLVVAARPPAPAATFHGVGDLPGGGVYSQIRDATKAGGLIYAVGSSAANPGSTLGDTAVLWTSTDGLVALPNLVSNATALSFITASAITPDAAYIAARLRSVASGGARLAARVTRDGLTNLNLGTAGGLTGNSAAVAISADGGILYGIGQGLVRAVRYTAAGPTATLLPLPHPDDTEAIPAGRGTSADGAVMVGTSRGPAGRWAFRYVHGAGVTVLPRLPGGTWNGGLAVASDGGLTLLFGDSTPHTNGAVYLHEPPSGVQRPLGSPNPPWFPSNLGGMTADGAVAAVNFDNLAVTPFKPAAYFRNRHGWWRLAAALAAQGVDLTALGWRVDVVLGVSPDGTLVFGEGQHHGAREGYVAEFPAGLLAEFRAVAAPPANPDIVGAWTLGDPAGTGQILLFLADGTYFHLQDSGAAGAAAGDPAGVERGTYAWDAATGRLSVITSIDTSGGLGLSELNGVSGVTLVLAGDTATLRAPGSPDASLARLRPQPGTLVGGWQAGDGPPESVFVFLPGGLYFQADATDPLGLGGDDGGRDGLERGTYTWNAATGAFAATPSVDANGDWGFSGLGPGVTIQLTDDEAGLVMTAGGETVHATRVAAAPAAVSLAIALDGGSVRLSWPASATGYVLQGADSLSAPNWQPEPGSPVTVDGRFEQSVSLSGTARWFRLFRP